MPAIFKPASIHFGNFGLKTSGVATQVVDTLLFRPVLSGSAACAEEDQNALSRT
jgi:hypothetical protein